MKVHASAGVPTLANGGLTEAELKKLGNKKVNGRQIKNAVHMATANADGNNEVLGYKHLVKALDNQEQFEKERNAMCVQLIT